MIEFNRQWQPAVDFKEAHPKAKLICTEWIGLSVQTYSGCSSCGDRPVKQSRLDWAEEMFKKANELDLSWCYWSYVHMPLPGSSYIHAENPIESDGSENIMSQIIKEYAIKN
jgi:hypothetical protein